MRQATPGAVSYSVEITPVTPGIWRICFKVTVSNPVPYHRNVISIFYRSPFKIRFRNTFDGFIIHASIAKTNWHNCHLHCKSCGFVIEYFITKKWITIYEEEFTDRFQPETIYAVTGF